MPTITDILVQLASDERNGLGTVQLEPASKSFLSKLAEGDQDELVLGYKHSSDEAEDEDVPVLAEGGASWRVTRVGRARGSTERWLIPRYSRLLDGLQSTRVSPTLREGRC